MTVYVKPTFIINGVPLAGGYVKVFEQGSYSILKTTYIDSSLTIPNTNPIVLDASGSADIWLSGPASYEVYDSNWVFKYREPVVFGFGSSSININTINQAEFNLRALDVMTATLGLAADRCGKWLGPFDCDGNPTLITTQEMLELLQFNVIAFWDLGFFCCTETNTFDFGSFADPIEGYIDLGIFT